MTKTIEKIGKLQLSDEEFDILLDVLESLPRDTFLLSQLAGLRYGQTCYLLPEIALPLLEEIDCTIPNRELWKSVLDKFNKFKNTNLIVL